MTGSEYIIRILKKYGVTDVFGIPGAVILELIYAFDCYGIKPHLCYHEQSAGFAACGYAQTKNSLGVAYATKGPGFTNLITAIADAYYDSVPVLFITAHTSKKNDSPVRFMTNQEIDTVSMVSHITKYAEYVETREQLLVKMEDACAVAMQNRKGPVLLDFNSELLGQIITDQVYQAVDIGKSNQEDTRETLDIVTQSIDESRRPVILIGNGIKQSRELENLEFFCINNRIPILSSRTALDSLAYSDIYFGYIGSRGLRYSNFILAKCDVIISIGNRMAYHLESDSFREIMQGKRVIRIEIDEAEFERKIPNSVGIVCDLNDILHELKNTVVHYKEAWKWLQTCRKLRDELYEYDVNGPVQKLADILQMIPENLTLVCDVGNNALWLSRAHNYLKLKNKVLFSMGLACLGNALCKSIGVFYASKQPVVCLIGDQGAQMNIQELEFLAYNRTPVFIILINNQASGMIRNWERQKYGYDLHTSPESGYGIPDFEKIAQAYDIEYIEYIGRESVMHALECCKNNRPVLLNVFIDPSDEVVPSLRRGAVCYNMTPELPSELYESLVEL